MKPRITLAQTFVWLVVLFFQFIMTQGVLLLLSLLFPVTDNILGLNRCFSFSSFGCAGLPVHSWWVGLQLQRGG